MTSKNKIYFFVEGKDNRSYIGLSLFLKKQYENVKRCSKFFIDDEKNKSVVNITLNSPINNEDFDNISNSIIQYFKKDLMIFYKTGEETDKKYTYSNLQPKKTIEEPKKYLFIPDEY